MALHRVFITGMGAITACGNTADSTWNAIVAGQTGIDSIKQWDLSSWEYRLGGELKNFQPTTLLPDRKLIKVISRQDVIGINAAMQAIEHSQIIDFRNILDENARECFNEKTAIYVGSPGNKYFQQNDFLPLLAQTKGEMSSFADHLFDVVHPMWLLRILPNNVLAYTGITYGFKGPNHNITNHAVSGMQAIIEAYHAISCGQAERAVVIAYDTIEPQALFYYSKLGLISARHLRPFDKEHDGTILAEGAGALVLESEASVQARSAKCYAEMIGGRSASEGGGLFSVCEQGEALSEMIKASITYEDLAGSERTFIVAHGNGNSQSDNSEANAITRVGNSLPVTAFKWALGHSICASGVVDTVMATYALRNTLLPGIANLNQPSPLSTHLSLCKDHRQLKTAKKAVVINRGFAGMNACVVIKSCD